MIDGKTVFNNMIWKFAERISAQIVTFAVSIILARLLDPADYGMVSIVMVFITIANVFVSDGLGSALIQKKDADNLDFSSSLYFNIFFSIIIYCILFILSPSIELFFGSDYSGLSLILRVLGLRIIVSGINSVQQAYISRNMMFEKFFIATLLGTVASAVVGIWMAYQGYGAWSLVFQYLINTTVDTVVLAIVIGKIPSFIISFDRIKQLFDYGIKILASGLLITAYTEIRSFIIGKKYTPADLAYYDKARQFPSLFVNNIVATISAVLFPKMANEQNDLVQIKNTTKKSIRVTTYLMCPLMFGLASVAKPLVLVLLTEKWLPCVPLLQSLCITYLWQPIHSANLQAIKAVGRSDIYLKVEVIKKIIEIIILVIVMNISVDAIVISMSINATLFVLINAWPNRELLNYSITEQIEDMISPFAMSFAMMTCIILLQNLMNNNTIVSLCIQIFIGVVSYLFLSIISKNKEFNYICNLLMNYKKSK